MIKLLEDNNIDLDVAELPNDARLLALANYLGVSPFEIEEDDSTYWHGYKNINNDEIYMVLTGDEIDEKASSNFDNMISDGIFNYFNLYFIIDYLLEGAFDDERDSYVNDLIYNIYSDEDIISELINFGLADEEEIDNSSDLNSLKDKLYNHYVTNIWYDSLFWAQECLGESGIKELIEYDPDKFLDINKLKSDAIDNGGRESFIWGTYNNTEIDLDFKNESGNWLYAYRMD